MIALLLALALAQAPDAGATAQPLDFNSRVTPSQVKLGEPFVYELVITHKPDQRYELVRPKELGDFELFDVQRARTDAPDGRAVTTFKARMSAFALGKQVLPELTFEVIDEQGARTFTAKGIEVEILSSLPADAEQTGAQLYDIRPPTEVPVRSYRLLWILGAMLVTAVVAFLATRWWQQRKLRPIPAPPPIPLGARVRGALDQLRAEELPAKGRSREFYFRLSEIVRGYLGERYGFEALECTSGELMAALRKLPTPGLPVEDFARFNDDSDLVKFARQDATPDQCKQALDFAYLVLDRTWPPPPPPEPILDATIVPPSPPPPPESPAQKNAPGRIVQ